MRRRIVDKIFILLMIIAATFFLLENVMAIHVCLILISIIVLALDELIMKQWYPFVIALATAVAMCFLPIAVLLAPTAAYILSRKRKTIENVAISVLYVITMHTADSVKDAIFKLLIILVAAYIAYYTSYYEDMINHSEARFDEARREAAESAKKRRELRERTEADIYTATLKERNRIARDIHDNVGHMLTRAVVQLQAILVINKDENIKPYLDSVNATVNEAMTNIRKSVHELHDDSIDLSIGVNELTEVLKERFEVNVSTAIESPVSNEMKMQILGIIKECVTNISKHSNGNKALVEVVENVTFWRIRVYDNGKSEPVDISGSTYLAIRNGEHGIGLENIITRAKNLNGRTTITGGQNGFTVMVTIPKEK